MKEQVKISWFHHSDISYSNKKQITLPKEMEIRGDEIVSSSSKEVGTNGKFQSFEFHVPDFDEIAEKNFMHIYGRIDVDGYGKDPDEPGGSKESAYCRVHFNDIKSRDLRLKLLKNTREHWREHMLKRAKEIFDYSVQGLDELIEKEAGKICLKNQEDIQMDEK